MSLHPKIKALKSRTMPINYTLPNEKSSTLAVRADGELEDERTVKGYLVVWGVRDSYGTMFMKGCCAKSIRDRGPESNSKYKIVMLWQHIVDDPIGQYRVLKEDDYGLYFEAYLDDPEAVPSAKRAARQIKSGTINQFSIGFDIVWDKVEYDETTDCIVFKEIDLFEGSPVTMGANAETYAIRAAKNLQQAKEDLLDETEDFIKTIPRNKQLELRQIIARQISLAKLEPDELRHHTLEANEPTEDGIDYQYLSNHFKL